MKKKVQKSDSDFWCVIGCLAIVVGIIYVIISSVQFGSGVMDAHRSGCRAKMARYEYAMPGYRLGCYMGLAPGDTNEEQD